jgi:hypothetical protein
MPRSRTRSLSALTRTTFDALATACYILPVLVSLLAVRVVLWRNGQPRSKPDATAVRCLIMLGSSEFVLVGTLKTGYPRVQAPGQDRRPALGPPRVLRTQLPLPGPGQLRSRHVSCGPSSRCPARGRHVSRKPSSRCPARGSSGAAACPAALAPAAQPEAAPGSPRVPWKPSGRRAIKVTDIP